MINTKSTNKTKLTRIVTCACVLAFMIIIIIGICMQETNLN